MTDTTTTAPSREAIKQELETTKAGYHQLLDSLSADDFKKKSGNSTWSNGQLMWHVAWGTEFVPDGVERCRKGKNLPLPRGVFNALNPWVTRWGSRGATPESVSKKFDAALDKAIAALATVKDDEWTRGAKIAGDDTTVEQVLHQPATHFAEHKADILKSLGRA